MVSEFNVLLTLLHHATNSEFYFGHDVVVEVITKFCCSFFDIIQSSAACNGQQTAPGCHNFIILNFSLKF